MVKRIITNGNGTRLATMRDVARSAGVSQATVSYVLNGKREARVGSETKQRVLDAAARLEYRPNAIARAMALGRSRTIGVYVPHVPDSPLSGFWSTMVMRGIGAALHHRQYHLLLYGYRESEDPPPSAFLDGRVDGLIILAPHEDDGLPQTLANLGFPMAVVGGRHSSGRMITIDVDNIAGARVATEYLIGLGHTRIAHLAGPADVPNANDRRLGFEQAMQSRNIPLPAEYVQQSTFDSEGGYTSAMALLKTESRPTAILAANDICALGALRAAAECNLRVPEDVSVVGYDDAQVCEVSSPRLTTMRQPAEQMGQAAAEMLLSRRKDADKPSHALRFFPAELVVRDSTAACSP